MKINNDYPVRSDRTNKMSPLSDVVLYEDNTETRDNVFPRQLAVNDYMIQDPRYLQTYANYFCKFIDAYKEQGIPIDMIMYQNEAYSYTPYPGCAWTAEGTVRFNVEYLAPTLKKHHPEVTLYLGTFNTNRYDYVDKILSDPRIRKAFRELAFSGKEDRYCLKYVPNTPSTSICRQKANAVGAPSTGERANTPSI